MNILILTRRLTNVLLIFATPRSTPCLIYFGNSLKWGGGWQETQNDSAMLLQSKASSCNRICLSGNRTCLAKAAEALRASVMDILDKPLGTVNLVQVHSSKCHVLLPFAIKVLESFQSSIFWFFKLATFCFFFLSSDASVAALVRTFLDCN